MTERRFEDMVNGPIGAKADGDPVKTDSININ